jgi:hypothetical protein
VANAVILVHDDRVRRQVEQYLDELGIEDLRHASFATFKEFQELYFHDQESGLEEPENAATGEAAETSPTDLKLFSEIHLLIFALDVLNEKFHPWMNRLKQNMKRYECYPASGPVRTMMLKYEDDGIHKTDLVHPLLDDIIFLPMDRLIFLQKTEILLALPKRAAPRFLFNQEVQQQIEISKIARVDRLSDVGLAIHNPIALKRGTPGKFYVTFPGEKNQLEIRAKVIRSQPHPEYRDQHLVFFSYFGINKNDLLMVRRVLSKDSHYQGLLNEDRNAVRFNPDDLFLEESEQRIFGVAVVDSDGSLAKTLAASLVKDMDRLQVLIESSFSVFMHKYMEAGGSQEKTPPKACDDADFYNLPITLSLAMEDLKCLSVDPGPNGDQLLLGHPAAEVFSTPDHWLSLLQDKESRLIIEEAARLVQQGRVLQKLIIMQDRQNQRRAVNAKIYKGATDQVMALELSPASFEDIFQYAAATHQKFKLNAMIVDSAFLPEDPSGWFSGLRTRARQVDLCEDANELKFFAIGEPDDPVTPGWLSSPDISGYLTRPVDTRQLLFLLSEMFQNKNTLFHFDNLGWSQPRLIVHVAKNVRLEALSEFGARLRSPTALVPGTVIYLRKSIYANTAEGCVAARVYSCEQDPNDKEGYQVYTTYFGITDAFLKFARTWIRENYAQQKSQGGG